MWRVLYRIYIIDYDDYHLLALVWQCMYVDVFTWAVSTLKLMAIYPLIFLNIIGRPGQNYPGPVQGDIHKHHQDWERSGRGEPIHLLPANLLATGLYMGRATTSRSNSCRYWNCTICLNLGKSSIYPFSSFSHSRRSIFTVYLHVPVSWIRD